MRILIHGINFSPELTGIGKYSGELAEWLALQGHEVRVVTAPPYYPQWKIADGYANWWHKQSVNLAKRLPASGGGLLVYRCPLWVPAKPSGLKRLLHLASFALTSLPVMLRQVFWRPHIVFVVEPPLFCAPQALLVARLSGARAWLHVQDFEVDAAFDLGLIKGARLRSFVAAAERWLLSRFHKVSTISQRMLDRLLLKGVVADQCVFFPNWVDVSAIVPSPQAAGLNASRANALSYRHELGIDANAVVALYSGNMGGKQGLEILAQATVLLGDLTGIVFVFCGNGAERPMLERECSGLENVRFLDLQPLERLGELLSMADIHLLPQRADAADLVMPSKLTGMLASGRPVVATAIEGTELAKVVAGCGLVVPPATPMLFADAIKRLVNDAGLRAGLGAAGRKYAEDFLDKGAVLSQFELNIKQLINAQK
ncbi:glycosyltransferase WbuB [Methylotenera sp. G11]|uniref:glycosyltransferase WbuB n=1 Tax=Methylotenera sp. G11 TaxID=1506585 RepID=UPI0006463DD7|nr:glycosyltransferase WbuB [Methylotenera sp. G11]